MLYNIIAKNIDRFLNLTSLLGIYFICFLTNFVKYENALAKPLNVSNVMYIYRKK